MNASIERRLEKLESQCGIGGGSTDHVIMFATHSTFGEPEDRERVACAAREARAKYEKEHGAIAPGEVVDMFQVDLVSPASA